jgi:SAM-dependent methyltransferase
MTLRRRIFAATYDRFTAKAEQAGLAAHRAALLAGAWGRVIEIGGGTGANLAHYGVAVESLTVTEPEPAMLRRLTRRAREIAPTAMVLRAPSEDLPFDDAAFDIAVSTLTLCSVDDQRRAVGELRRVLRPGGPSALPRARPRRRRARRPSAGPDELAQPPRRVLRLQPPDPRHAACGGLRARQRRAHRVGRRTPVRPTTGPRHRRQRPIGRTTDSVAISQLLGTAAATIGIGGTELTAG